MSAALEVAQHHDATEMAYVERVGCRVDAELCCHMLFLQQLFCSWHHLVYHTAPGKFFNKVFH